MWVWSFWGFEREDGLVILRVGSHTTLLLWKMIFFSFFSAFFVFVILRFQSLVFRGVWRDGFLFCFFFADLFMNGVSMSACAWSHTMPWTCQHELKCVDACGRHTKLTPVQKCTCRRPLKQRSNNAWWYFDAKFDAERLQSWEYKASVNESCNGKVLQKNTTTLRCKHCQSFVSPVINAQASTDMWTM